MTSRRDIGKTGADRPRREVTPGTPVMRRALFLLFSLLLFGSAFGAVPEEAVYQWAADVTGIVSYDLARKEPSVLTVYRLVR